jgi:acetyl-CoA carboxylase beta subunit
MGGADRVVRQRELGKLTVRERLDLLLDPGTWVEYALLADHMDAGLGDRYLAADGAITGIGEIDGRPVAVAAYDFTVMAGSMGGIGEARSPDSAPRAGLGVCRSCGCSTPRARPVDVGLDIRRRERCSGSRSR